MEHEAGERDEMQPCQHLRQALIVASKATKARGPGEVALDDPSPQQEHEAVFGLGLLDDFQVDALDGSIRSRLFPFMPRPPTPPRAR